MKKIYFLGLLALSSIANSATITVDTNTIAPNDGVCDLADAISSANTDTAVDSCESGVGNDNIVLGINTTIFNSLPDITSSITMARFGTLPIIQGGAGLSGRIFNITPSGTLTLSEVSVRGGNVNGNGGCIFNSGVLNLTNDSVVQGCIATGNGGGIYNAGTLSINSSRIALNEALLDGGAIYTAFGSQITLFNNSEIAGNDARNGGGLYDTSGGIEIVKTGFDLNEASIDGGAIYTTRGVNVFRSSFTRNSSGIFSNAFLNLANSTVSSNIDYGIEFNPIDNVFTMLLENVTIKNNQGFGVNIPTVVGGSRFENVAFDTNGTNCFSADNTFGSNNISSDLSCPVSSFSNSINLAPLAVSGTTRHHNPSLGSSLIDSGDNTVCFNSRINNRDQNLSPRPEPGGTLCDVGAIENPDGIVFSNSIELTKFGLFNDENNDGFAQVGETITYTFAVENTGDQALINVSIIDALISVPGVLPSLAVGAIDSSTFSAVYTIDQNDIERGEVLNIATVTGTDPSNNQVSDQSNNGVALVVRLPYFNAIDLVKSGVFNDENNDGFAQVGETITYSFELTNIGSQLLESVYVSDPIISLPLGIELNPGQSDDSSIFGDYILVQSDIDSGQVSNLATAYGTTPDKSEVSDQSNNGVPLITPLNVGNSIDLIKGGSFNDENNDGFAQVGETISYTFIVENTGSQSLSNVTIADPLTPVSGSLATMPPGQVDTTTFTASYALIQSDIDAEQVSNTATVSGTAPGNATVTDQSNNGQAFVINLNVNNSIDLIKGGSFNDENNDGFAQVGETISYTFTVENTGAQALSNVIIADPLTPVTGSLATMPPGQVDTTTFTASYALIQSDIEAEQVSNTATVSGSTLDNATVTDQSNNGQPFVINLNVNNSIDLIKGGSFNDENNDGFAQAGETISYTFTVENTGAQALSNVSIADPLTPVTGSLATMGPGQVDSTTFSASYALIQADIDAEQVSNTAIVSGTTPSNSTVTDQSNNGQAFVINLNINNSIDLIKAGQFNDENNDGLAQVGETVGFTFTVENTGAQALSNVTIADPLTPVSGSLASLSPGQVDSNSFTASYTLLQIDVDEGQVTNIATVSGTTLANGTVSDQSNNGVLLVVNLPGDASIDLIKTGVFNDENNDGFAQAGETISYSFEVENTGVLTLTNVSISDPLTPVVGSVASMNSGVIDTTTFTASYSLLQSDIDNGSVDNTATVSGFDPSNNQVTALSNNGLPFTIQLPSVNSIDLIKSGVFNDENNDGFAQVGETISYAFTVENTGSETLSNVTIADPLAPVSGSLATMTAGVVDSTTFTANYSLTQADIDRGDVSNIATVSGETNVNTTVTDVSNDGQPFVIQLDVFNAIALIKAGEINDINEDGFAQVGETITYTFTVLNVGDQTLSDIVIDDPLINVSGLLSNLAPGDEDSTFFRAVYSITSNDIASGVVSNLATVTGFDPEGNTVTDESNNGVPLDTFIIPPDVPEGVISVPVNNMWALLIMILMMSFIVRKKVIKA